MGRTSHKLRGRSTAADRDFLARNQAEDAVYDSQSIRTFVGIDLGREAAPDATALLHFRRLLEMQDLARAIIGAMKGHLAERGLLLREGTMVDATIIAAPPSPRNRAKARGGIRFPLANLVLARRLLPPPPPPQGVSAF